MVDHMAQMCSYLMISPESGVKNASTTGYSLVAAASDLAVATLQSAEVEEYVERGCKKQSHQKKKDQKSLCTDFLIQSN